MRILFCSDALLIDGVTSYILHIGAALARSGHEVAVLGRWAGKGFQRRYREEGMTVFSCPSVTVGNQWFDAKAKNFAPDVILTDSRRSFPLAVRLKKITRSPIITYFLDHLEKTDRPGRDVHSLVRWSDAWAVAEDPIRRSLLSTAPDFPVFPLPRPLDTVVTPSPLPSKSPFRILCFGRLSRYKTPGMFHILENAEALQSAIPDFEVVILGGGGWRLVRFKMLAWRINRRLGRSCVRVVGAQDDPRPWLKDACVVCGASTSAIEAALSLRPVVAFSSFWVGPITPENLDEAVDCYFAERSGRINLSKPEARAEILPALFDIYKRYDQILPNLQEIQRRLHPLFNSEETVRCFKALARFLQEKKNCYEVPDAKGTACET